MAKQKLSNYIKIRLPAKIRKVKEDHPEMPHDQVLAVAINILREREHKGRMAKDIMSRERKNRGK